MKLGAHFLPEDFPAFVESVRAAERAGYERAWLVDGQMLWQDLYVYMTHALAATERLVIFDLKANPPKHIGTVEVGKQPSGLDISKKGDLALVTNRADNSISVLSISGKDVKLADTVPRLRAWMAGEEAAGTRIRWADETVPIMLCATGPKNLRLAGALADIVMIYVGVHPASVRWAIDHVRAGAEEAGRDPDDVGIAALCALHVSDDQEEAWEECRWAPAACANHIAYALKWNPQHGMPEEMTRLAGARINQHGPPAGNEPRDVAGTGERAGVEGMDGNRIQNFKETVS